MIIYIEELFIWIVLVLAAIFLFRFIPYKMKQTENHYTRNTLFTLMLIFGIPLILFIVIAPFVILMGDHNMPVGYKIAFGCEIAAVVVYFIVIQRTKDNLPL